jgi:hypothetical protein
MGSWFSGIGYWRLGGEMVEDLLRIGNGWSSYWEVGFPPQSISIKGVPMAPGLCINIQQNFCM